MVAHIMGLALRHFSKEVSALEKCKEIMWDFSGTRPNMTLEFKIACKYGAIYDISQDINDFDADTVITVLKHYLSLSDISERLKERLNIWLAHQNTCIGFFIVLRIGICIQAQI